jgi:Protein of unknown function (DUF2516)
MGHLCTEASSVQYVIASAFWVGAWLFWLIIILFGLGLVIAAIIHAASTPKQAFRAARQSKIAWIVSMAVLGIVLWPIGIVLAVVYLLSVRPKLDAVRTTSLQ